MNSATNVSLLVVGTGLISVGANTIATGLLTGGIEILLGIAVYALYEFTPTKTPTA